jgi:hypothetical protein
MILPGTVTPPFYPFFEIQVSMIVVIELWIIILLAAGILSLGFMFGAWIVKRNYPANANGLSERCIELKCENDYPKKCSDPIIVVVDCDQVTEQKSQSSQSISEFSFHSACEYNSDIDPEEFFEDQLETHEVTIVDEFRNRLRQENLHLSRHTDVFLSKLLEARQGNIENALILLKTSEQSRKEFKIDRIVSDFVCSERKRVEELFPFYNHGVDKIGRPILFIEFDKADSRILFSPAVTNPDRFLQLIIRKLEENAWKLQAAYEANPLSEGQMVMIMNVDGAYFSQFAKVAPIMKQAFDVLLNCYPECLGSMFIINAPYLFTAIWSIMSIWFDARTLSKIKILGRNYHQELYATIEQETLPVKYGGKCTCPGEENGCRASDIGVWKNANEYSYWQDMRKRDLNDTTIVF